MYTNKSKFILASILQCVFVFMIFISSLHKDLLLDIDGIKIFSSASFIISIDMCVFIFKNFSNKKNDEKNK